MSIKSKHNQVKNEHYYVEGVNGLVFDEDGNIDHDMSIVMLSRENIDITQKAFAVLALSNPSLNFEFYGVDVNTFKIGCNGNTYVFEAIENPDDGYRSMMDTILVRTPQDLIFSDRPIANVVMKFYINQKVDYSFTGFDLIDVKSEEMILRIGTECYDSYYPEFIVTYDPSCLNT